jgi:uncharacterized protein DUF6130
MTTTVRGNVRRVGAVIAIAAALCARSAAAQTAKDVKGATPLVAVQNEAPAKLIADPPIPEQLALGRVFIQYRTENLRIRRNGGPGRIEAGSAHGQAGIGGRDAQTDLGGHPGCGVHRSP